MLREKNTKIEFQQIIKREEESRKTIKDLQKFLIDIKVDKEVEIQKRNELIAHLKDRLQELKANLGLLYNFMEICFSICKKCKILFISEKYEEIGSDVKEI